MNFERHSAPTRHSAAVAGILTATYVVLASLLALMLDNVDGLLREGVGGAAWMWFEATVAVLVFAMTLCVVFLAMQPKTTQELPFKVSYLKFIRCFKRNYYFV